MGIAVEADGSALDSASFTKIPNDGHSDLSFFKTMSVNKQMR